jgi:hypothetical protein
MRRLLTAVLAVSLASCSRYAEFSISFGTDADVPVEPVDEDAGADAEADSSVVACARATSCAPVGACDGGTRYSCIGAGHCPTGDVGACSNIAVSGDVTSVTETCCERLACVRNQYPGDAQCRDDYNVGAASTGWTCPWRNGQQAAKPPGTCGVYGRPTIERATTAVDVCCR